MQRYGIKKAGGNRYPLIAVSALIVSAWFIWSGYNAANPEVRSDLISFKNIDDQSISITYSIQARNINIDHSCSLIARDLEKNTVGEVSDLMPAGSLLAGKNQRTVVISTRLPAVNAGISSCE
ncbi:MAG: DUF4307 domain-containing protein [Actinobacteria bacterium]|nr:DUF4307 domain-containing protein [Actinomycetota bacterium]